MNTTGVCLIMVALILLLVLYSRGLYPANNHVSHKKYEGKLTPIDRVIIVEPRPHPALAPVLRNVCSVTQSPLTIVHGTHNGDFVKRLIKNINCTNVRFLEVNAANLNRATYSMLLTTKQFWEQTSDPHEENLLIFQTDSGFCDIDRAREAIKEAVNSSDICGAVTPGTRFRCGGLSIRKRSTTLRHLEENQESLPINEDVVFGKWCLKDPNCSMCTIPTAHRFAVETKLTGEIIPAGFHNPRGRAKIPCHFAKRVKDLHHKGKWYNAPDRRSWKPRLV